MSEKAEALEHIWLTTGYPDQYFKKGEDGDVAYVPETALLAMTAERDRLAAMVAAQASRWRAKALEWEDERGHWIAKSGSAIYTVRPASVGWEWFFEGLRGGTDDDRTAIRVVEALWQARLAALATQAPKP